MDELPTTQECAEIALEIIKRAMMYNRVPTERATTGDKPTFFVWFSGHVNALDLQIQPIGWGDNEPELQYEIALSPQPWRPASIIAEELHDALDKMVEVQKAWEEKQNGE